MTRTASPRRLGFTLVELLVVVALIILLATLTVAVSQSGMFGSQRVVGGADRVGTWLLIAKNRALRDKTPRGVRFLMTPDLTDSTYFRVTEAQYIEAPAAWIPNPLQENNPTGPRIVFCYQFDTTTKSYKALDVYYVSFDPNNTNQGVADMAEFQAQVAAGDLLVLPEFGSSFRIDSFATPTTPLMLGTVSVPPTHCRVLKLHELVVALTTPTDMSKPLPHLGAAHSPATGAPQGTLMTYKFNIQPQPRPLLGEPTVQLPADVIIDYRAVAPQTTIGVSPISYPGEQPYFDILFAPSGKVLGNAGLICLWVRDPNKVPHPRKDPLTGLPDDRAGFNEAGEQVLIAVYTHTGLNATFPVNPTFVSGYDPYKYAKDGVNSGL